MRQIPDMPSTPDNANASTCGFFTRKRQCAQGFQNLPHTSVRRFRKCGENRDLPTRPRFYTFTTCGFVATNQVALGGFRFFPRTSGIRGPAKRALTTMAASATTSSSHGNIKGPLPENRTTTLLCLRLT